MTLEELKKQNINFAANKDTPSVTEYIVSFSAIYQRPSQKQIILEDTICCEITLASKKAKDLLEAIKKYILKEKFKDTREANLKKLIIFNIYKMD